ncbi:hypothetical protein RvY_09535 [Ramazzottius varieornatus]|uniref:Mitochondrial genome maintenance exonuclease 1 n=1 Tax=Ramazzottius varieornatus TaxID=947166 RepID=A0A1D1VBV5_RAMVA|nr:hypothetical protein RvY_09535 [Ramazzottius varieornatus]
MDRVTAPLRHLSYRRCNVIIQIGRYKSSSKPRHVPVTTATDTPAKAETSDSDNQRKDVVKNSSVVGGNYPLWEDMKTVYGDLLVGKQGRKKYVKKYKNPITHNEYVLESDEEKRRKFGSQTSFDIITAMYGPPLAAQRDFEIPREANLAFDLENLQQVEQPDTFGSEEAIARWEFMGNNAKHLIGKPSQDKKVSMKTAKVKVLKTGTVDEGMFDAHTESLYGPIVPKTRKVIERVSSREKYTGPGIKRTDRFGVDYISPVPALQTSAETLPDEAKCLFGPVVREPRKASQSIARATQNKSAHVPLEIPEVNEAESGTSWLGENEDAKIFGPVLSPSPAAGENSGPYERMPGADLPSSSLYLAANRVNKKAAQTVKNSLKEIAGTPETGEAITQEPLVGATVARQKLSVDMDDYRVVELKTEGDLKAVPQSPLMNKLRPNYIGSSHELVLPGAIVMKICPEQLLGKPLAPEKYPSVTAILDVTMPSASRERLDAWKRRKIAELGVQGFQLLQQSIFSDGKGFHTAVETVLRGTKVNEVAVPKRNEGHWESLKNVFSDLSDVVCIEERVQHPFLCYKGVTDCVASLEGQPCVIEWKTSATKKDTVDALYDNPIQVAAYLGAVNFDENMRSKNVQVPNAAVVVAYSSGEPASVVRFDHNLISSYWAAWLRRLQQYWRLAAMQKSLPQRKFD